MIVTFTSLSAVHRSVPLFSPMSEISVSLCRCWLDVDNARQIRTHITQRSHSASHQLPISQPHSQAQVRDADVSFDKQK